MTTPYRTERDVLVNYAVDCIGNDALWMKLLDCAEDNRYSAFRETVFAHTRDHPLRMPAASYPKRRLVVLLWRWVSKTRTAQFEIDASSAAPWHNADADALLQRSPCRPMKPTPVNSSNSESETMNDKNAQCVTAAIAVPNSQWNTPIKHVTLVYGHDVTDQSEDTLVSTIEHIEADIAKVQALASKSKYLTKRVTELQAALKAVTDELDSRT